MTEEKKSCRSKASESSGAVPGGDRRDWAREGRAMRVRRARTLLADVRERALAHSRVSEALGPASGGAVAARRVSGKFSGDTSPVRKFSGGWRRGLGGGGGCRTHVSIASKYCAGDASRAR